MSYPLIISASFSLRSLEWLSIGRPTHSGISIFQRRLTLGPYQGDDIRRIQDPIYDEEHCP